MVDDLRNPVLEPVGHSVGNVMLSKKHSDPACSSVRFIIKAMSCGEDVSGRDEGSPTPGSASVASVREEREYLPRVLVLLSILPTNDIVLATTLHATLKKWIFSQELV